MSILPAGTALTFTGAATGQVYVDTLEYEFIVEPFDRSEFSNAKLRTAPTTSGATPMIVQSFGNRPIQLASTCVGDSPRPLSPDDANVNSIKQQFNIDRFTLIGVSTYGEAINNLYVLSKNHKNRISKFNLHIEKANMELSYSALIAMQSETFSYLTSTGLSVSGPALEGGLSNLLITEFSPSVEYITTSSGLMTKTWKMVFEIRTISNRVS